MDQRQIYERHPNEYDALVSAEDCEGNLMPALEAVASFGDRMVLEVGAGTGRVTRLLAGRGARGIAIDRAAPMLEVAREHLEKLSSNRWTLLCADARELPVASRWADVAVAGWTFGHFRHWLPDGWQAAVQRALDEMTRALEPGGALIVVETLGTGRTEPSPPSSTLEEYYRWLETRQCMQRQTIRTDYLFPDVQTAAETMGFFFGAAFAERVQKRRWTRVPECTGVWSKRV